MPRRTFVTENATAAVIRDQFELSCVELFSSLDCTVFKHDSVDMEMDSAPIAFIDAGSEDLEVVIVLHVPLSVLTMTYPEFAAESIMAVSEQVLEDWISELANQLVGRFKNKMISHGCRLKIGLPAMYYDSGDATLPIEGHEPFRFFFDIDKELVECSLYLQLFNPDLQLSQPEEDSNGAGEGELELF